MIRVNGYPQHYEWGSRTLIPRFLGEPDSPIPVAELWFGSHPLGPAAAGNGQNLRDLIEEDPRQTLGPSTQYAFGNTLPFMMKLIAPAAPLSLQVHPRKSQAQSGYLREDAADIPLGAPHRIYRDANHKPELLYAIEEFVALVGFTVRRQARTNLEGLDSPLAGKLSRRLLRATGRGVRPVVSWLLDPEYGPNGNEITEFARDCENRLNSGQSPCPAVDQTVANLAAAHPQDPGIAVAFLMNPVALKPGEAIFVPPGTLHSYQSGLGLELMANSDNVIRAGLTPKHIDREHLVEIGNFNAVPPIRVAPEHPLTQISRFYVPVEDFELTVVTLENETVPVGGTGPRLAICIDGEISIMTREREITLKRGECVFVPDAEGPTITSGTGTLAQCSAP